MKGWLRYGTIALTLLVASCGGGDGNEVEAPAGGTRIAPIPPPNGSDWTQVVEETADGGFRMGNPTAPVKLVEYGSLSCPGCAQFDVEATPPLENDYIKSGRVSWEFRPFMIHAPDPALTLAARCNGPAAFFLLKQQLYASQGEWIQKMESGMPNSESLSPEQRLKGFIQAGGLDVFFRQRGIPQAKLDACLSDQAAVERVLQVSQRGSEQFDITSTPTLIINGVKVSFTKDAWGALEPQLKRALGE